MTSNQMSQTASVQDCIDAINGNFSTKPMTFQQKIDAIKLQLTLLETGKNIAVVLDEILDICEENIC